MTMRLGLHMCESRNGHIIADWTDDAEDVLISSGDHGFHTLSFFVAMGSRQAFQYYNLSGVPYIGVFQGGDPVWEGRVEDIAIVDGGITISAFGYWSALSDAPYTALWSYSGYADWNTLNDDDISTALPDRWTLDNNNRLYFAPNREETFGTSEARAYWAFLRPSRSENYILEVDFSYELTGASSWELNLVSWQDGYTSETVEWTLNGNGGTQSGSTSITLTGSNVTGVGFRMFYDTTAAQYTGDTGDVYGKLTSVRVKAVTTATVTAKVIVEDLVDFIATLNGFISSATTAIFDPSVDLKDAIFEDQFPADIIMALAELGDNSTPAKIYDASIWEGGHLHFHQYGGHDHLEWFTDVSHLQLERSLETLTNSYYAVYEGKQRTAVAKNNNSIAVHGIERRGFIEVSTSSQTQAEAARDAQLECTCGQPRATIAIDGLFDKRGGSYPYWNIRAGDQMTLRNLDPDIVAFDELRTFFVKTTELDLKKNILTVTPEELPELDLLVAQGNL